MLRAEALRILGCSDEASEAEVRAAFAAFVKAAHPDLNKSNPAFSHAFALAKAKKARDLLIKRFEPLLPACERCAGMGVIKGLSKFGTTCKYCQGTGRNTRR